MRRALIVLVATCVVAVAVEGAERLAVLEFFGRTTCPNCQHAASAIVALQSELAGSAVLLEYDADGFADNGRTACYLAADPYAYYLPLVMVGSGYRTSSGYLGAPLSVYRGMVNDELARPPAAVVKAFWRRDGNAVRCYARVTNLRSAALTPGESAAVWAIVWEDAHIGLTSTWVRTAVRKGLVSPLAPGATADLVIDTGALSPSDWSKVSCLALVERRPDGSRTYDALQAAVASAAGLTATPSTVVLTPGNPRAVVALDGPPVLSWTASADADWLSVSPAAGGSPATVTITVDLATMPRSASSGTVRFDAAGDGMTSTATVQLSWSGRLRPPRRLLRATGPGGGS